MAVALVEHQAGSFALEFWGKGTTLLGHQTPLYGEHFRLNGCPESLDHYILVGLEGQNATSCKASPVIARKA
ncbi:hypothetical protein D3C79_919010 [compost metagenome]